MRLGCPKTVRVEAGTPSVSVLYLSRGILSKMGDIQPPFHHNALGLNLYSDGLGLEIELPLRSKHSGFGAECGEALHSTDCQISYEIVRIS